MKIIYWMFLCLGSALAYGAVEDKTSCEAQAKEHSAEYSLLGSQLKGIDRDILLKGNPETAKPAHQDGILIVDPPWSGAAN